MTTYERQGYKNRMDYLRNLAEEYDIDLDMVLAGADALGETEDFDGLVSMIQDYSYV